jgi:hypothetical protein
MRKSGFIKMVLLVVLCGISPSLPSAMAKDVVQDVKNVDTMDTIIPLGFIPDSLYSEVRANLNQQRQAAQSLLADFKAAAAAYSAESFDKQTDAEYNKVEDLRKKYNDAADAFNKALATEVATETARAAIPVARIAASRGEFYFVTKDGHKLTGAEAVACPLDGGTRVVTGPGSRLQLLLPDETVFTLGPSSDMVMDDFVFDPHTSATKMTANIAKGLFRFVTGKIASHDPNKVKVKVAYGTIGPRGTDFEVSVEPDGAGYVKLFSGKLEITETKSGNVFNMDAGQMVKFHADGTWEAPTSLDAARPSI